ncbi:MAG: S8 family peptidase [Bacillota bacterium]|nr:S8 family peptidase [Bacillota bacterium]
MMAYRKTKNIPVIIQSSEGIDGRIKRCIKKFGGSMHEEYPIINACSANIPPSGIKPLESLYQVRYLTLDYPVICHLNNLNSAIGTESAHRLKVTGKNITVALLDTGTYPHPDIIRPRNRIILFKDFIDNVEFPYDDNGHGTFTAGIMLGNGTMSGNEYIGAAPEANLISLKVLNQSGSGRVSTVLSALQWILAKKEAYRIRIVCIPLGCMSFLPCDVDPLSRAVQVLWDSGVVVCASAGNNGPYNSWISSPGINPSIITVGAAQTRGKIPCPEKPLCTFSSRGYTLDGNQGPDFLAPGSHIVSLNADTAFIPKTAAGHRSAKLEYYYRTGSGTSAACAAVAGAAALILGKKPDLSPEELKSLLRHSSKSLNLVKTQQGYGIPDINQILE